MKKSNQMIKTTIYNQELIHGFYENLNVDSDTIKNSYTMINPTNTCVYLNRTFGWRQINVRKIFPEVINVRYGQRQATFTDFNLDCVTRNKETIDIA